MQETDPVKRLQMFSMDVEVRGRLHAIKMLFPLEYIIANQSEK